MMEVNPREAFFMGCATTAFIAALCGLFERVIRFMLLFTFITVVFVFLAYLVR